MMLLNSFRKVTQLRDRGPGHLVTLARPPDSLTRVRSGLEAGGSEDGLGQLRQVLNDTGLVETLKQHHPLLALLKHVLFILIILLVTPSHLRPEPSS